MQDSTTITRVEGDADLESLMSLLVQQHAYHVGVDPAFEQVAEWPEMKRSAYLQHLSDPNWLVLLCRMDDQPAAFLVATVRELPPFVRDRRQGFIEHLFVRPELRRHGIGTRLIERGFAWLRDQGVTGVELWVLSNNTLGKAFWSRTGFHPVRETMRRSLES